MIARPVAFAVPAFSLSLLDEEVDGDRHHRPDAGHHQREQSAERRGDQERNQTLLGLLGDFALERRRSRAGRRACWMEGAIRRRGRPRDLLLLGLNRSRRRGGLAVALPSAGTTVSSASGRVHCPGMLQCFASQTMITGLTAEDLLSRCGVRRES